MVLSRSFRSFSVFRSKRWSSQGCSSISCDSLSKGKARGIESVVRPLTLGGPAWVRRGSSSVPASEEVFQRLIDYRTSKVRELAKWIDKEVMFSAWGIITGGRVTSPHKKGAVLREVNSSYLRDGFCCQSLVGTPHCSDADTKPGGDLRPAQALLA